LRRESPNRSPKIASKNSVAFVTSAFVNSVPPSTAP
jgi:hypothetical protein